MLPKFKVVDDVNDLLKDLHPSDAKSDNQIGLANEREREREKDNYPKQINIVPNNVVR